MSQRQSRHFDSIVWLSTSLKGNFAMTLLADYEVIQSEAVVIGNSAPSNGQHPWKIKFDTGGRHDDKPAFIMLMVKSLNRGFDPEVRVNGTVVKQLSSTIAPDGNWSTQTIVFDGSILHEDEANNLEISAVPLGVNNGQFNDYTIKNVVCFFRQGADD